MFDDTSFDDWKDYFYEDVTAFINHSIYDRYHKCYVIHKR